MDKLSPTRKADRAEMARRLVLLAEQCGAWAETIQAPLGKPGELWVRIGAGPARVTIHIDAFAAKHGYVVPWYMSAGSDATYSAAFGVAVRAEVNPFHRRKCMGHEPTFTDLMAGIERALTCISLGEAFEQ